MEFRIGEFDAVDDVADRGAFRPCFFTAVSSSCTARSGACRVSEAKAAKRSDLEAQSSANFSF
jgi:hypothetical protein